MNKNKVLPEPKTVECHWCDGKGCWFDSAGGRNRCEECNGTGKVLKEEP